MDTPGASAVTRDACGGPSQVMLSSSHFSSHTVFKGPFCDQFNNMFLLLLCFLLILQFKWPPSRALRCCLVALSTKRLEVPYEEHTCVR